MVSDGSEFAIRSQYHSAGGSLITHIGDTESTIAVEGPFSWRLAASEETAGNDFHKNFALGHQFHALLLYFNDIVVNPQPVADIPFRGTSYTGQKGDNPYGGTVYLLSGTDESRPPGLLFEVPGSLRIEVTFGDWRQEQALELPFMVTIDDGERVFTYLYSDIRIGSANLIEYYASMPRSGLDQIEIYRLHRKLLAAHCLGDPALMADLTAPEAIVANRGRLAHTGPDEMRRRFGAAFQVWQYTAYHDLQDPEIEFSPADGIGWIAVNVRALGESLEDDETFDDQWAWIMLVRKVDGRWLNAGNASNLAEQDDSPN